MADTITIDELRAYVEARTAASRLASEARTYSREASRLHDILICKVRAIVNGKRSVRRHGYRLTIVDGRATVRWKDEFVKLAGPEHAALLQREAKRPEKLEVVRDGQD